MTKFTTPDLFDIHRDKLQVAEAGLIHFGGITQCSGQAVTVTCPQDNSKAVEMLKQPGHGKILVIDGFATKSHAFLGDQMAETAIKNAWSGIIVNACVRDIEILNTLPLTIMALGCVPASTVKRGFGDVNQVIKMQGIQISPENWLYIDINGLLVATDKLI